MSLLSLTLFLMFLSAPNHKYLWIMLALSSVLRLKAEASPTAGGQAMNRISIVIPMYNEARHIGRTLQAAQTAATRGPIECELIVVDNGSDDQGPQIARQFGAPGADSCPDCSSARCVIAARRSPAGNGWPSSMPTSRCPETWLQLLFDTRASGQADVFGLDLHTPAEAPWFADAWQRRTLRPDTAPSYRAMAAQFQPADAPRWFDKVGGFNETLRTGEDKELTMRLDEAGARLLAVNESVALHWGYEGSWREWMGKELWRQGSHLQLLRTHGPSLRLLRFPLLSIAAWVIDFMAISALLDGFPHHSLLMLLLTVLPAPGTEPAPEPQAPRPGPDPATLGPALGAPAPGGRRRSSSAFVIGMPGGLPVAEFIFWLCLLLPVYAYLGYPLLLTLLAPFYPASRHGPAQPMDVSIVIAAHNEARHIEEKLRTVLAQDYQAALAADHPRQ